ncbi:MAG: hypothetical protein GF349_00695 [Candidatus Magasanikbacteria bacterium]|nr:hypothetical protein [Candidatus Magasanikbacteria bacterium]
MQMTKYEGKKSLSRLLTNDEAKIFDFFELLNVPKEKVIDISRNLSVEEEYLLLSLHFNMMRKVLDNCGNCKYDFQGIEISCDDLEIIVKISQTADISGAIFVMEELKNIDVPGLIMNNVVFDNVAFEQMSFTGTDLSGSEFRKCEFKNCHFINAVMRHAVFTKSHLEKVQFDNTNLSGTFFGKKINGNTFPLNECFEPKTSSLLEEITFLNSGLDDCHFESIFFIDAEFNGCNCTSINVRFSEMANMLFESTDLSGGCFEKDILEAGFSLKRVIVKGLQFVNCKTFAINAENTDVGSIKLINCRLTNITDGLEETYEKLSSYHEVEAIATSFKTAGEEADTEQQRQEILRELSLSNNYEALIELEYERWDGDGVEDEDDDEHGGFEELRF